MVNFSAIDEYFLCIEYLQNKYTPDAKLLTGSPDATASLEEKAHYTIGVIIGSQVLAMESVANLSMYIVPY